MKDLQAVKTTELGCFNPFKPQYLVQGTKKSINKHKSNEGLIHNNKVYKHVLGPPGTSEVIVPVSKVLCLST